MRLSDTKNQLQILEGGIFAGRRIALFQGQDRRIRPFSVKAKEIGDPADQCGIYV